MIIIVPAYIKDFADFLNREYPASKDVGLTILHGYDSIEHEANGAAWAAYAAPEDGDGLPMIMLPGQVPEVDEIGDPEEVILSDFAHEYCHHLQWSEGRPFDEDEAEAFVECALTRYKGN